MKKTFFALSKAKFSRFSRLRFWGFLLAGTLAACAPLQGYPGPELPDEQVSIIVAKEPASSRVGPSKILRVSLDGIAFGATGIAVLPGQHEIDVFLEQLENKRNCVAHQEIDRLGYEACLRREFANRYRRRGTWFPCLIRDYTNISYFCDVDVHESDCHYEVATEAGQRYDLILPNQLVTEANKNQIHASAGIFRKLPQPQKVGAGECNPVRRKIEKRQFSAP